MLGAFDEALGNVTAALDARQMLGRTLLLFATDNGAPAVHSSSHSDFGTGRCAAGRRSCGRAASAAAASYGGRASDAAGGRNSSALIHASDWLLVLLLTAIGAPLSPVPHLDGVDVWASRARACRALSAILHNIDPLGTTSAAVRVGDTLIVGQVAPAAAARHRRYGGSAAAGETGPWIFNVRTDASSPTCAYSGTRMSAQSSFCVFALSRAFAQILSLAASATQADPAAARWRRSTRRSTCARPRPSTPTTRRTRGRCVRGRRRLAALAGLRAARGAAANTCLAVISRRRYKQKLRFVVERY